MILKISRKNLNFDDKNKSFLSWNLWINQNNFKNNKYKYLRMTCKNINFRDKIKYFKNEIRIILLASKSI